MARVLGKALFICFEYSVDDKCEENGHLRDSERSSVRASEVKRPLSVAPSPRSAPASS